MWSTHGGQTTDLTLSSSREKEYDLSTIFLIYIYYENYSACVDAVRTVTSGVSKTNISQLKRKKNLTLSESGSCWSLFNSKGIALSKHGKIVSPK